jgi:hypothetical protein
MRDGPRRLPLIALGAVGALIALILAGTYIYGEIGSAGVLMDARGPGAGGQTTEVFTVNGDWDIRWSYDCSPGLGNLFQKVDRCDFFLTVKQMSDCQVSPENHGIYKQHRVKDQGVVHYHAGGTFYFLVESDGGWTASVIGSGRASGVGPASHCSEG